MAAMAVPTGSSPCRQRYNSQLLNIRSVPSRSEAHRLQHLDATQRSTTPDRCVTPCQLARYTTLKLATQGSPSPCWR